MTHQQIERAAELVDKFTDSEASTFNDQQEAQPLDKPAIFIGCSPNATGITPDEIKEFTLLLDGFTFVDDIHDINIAPVVHLALIGVDPDPKRRKRPPRPAT